MEKIVILSGAGISAESGLKTFRDSDGLWEGYDVTEVASPDGWRKNPELVLDFYNQRRRQLKQVLPNRAHHAIKSLEEKFDVNVITQNVDDLHERAGSSLVIHLHGELKKVRSTEHEHLVYNWEEDLVLGDTCERGFQLRPHIVWFGEAVPMIEKAVDICQQATIFIIVGTSMQVYPAAGLIGYAPRGSLVYYIDPHPASSGLLSNGKELRLIAEKASTGVDRAVQELLS
jgi:NAD-dependent deacetylase